MSYTYKALTIDDVAHFRKLLEVFRDAFDGDGYTGTLPDDAYLGGILKKEHVVIVVALAEGKVIGGIAAFLLDKWEQKRKEMFVYDLAVAKEHRRKGVATGLINTLKGIARERGAYVMFVQADKEDEPAIKLYESFGKREDVHHFDISISD